MDRRDVVLAVALAVAAWLVWDWLLPPSDGDGGFPGVGLTAAFLLLVAVAVAYVWSRGGRPHVAGVVGLGLLVAGVLPFALFAPVPGFLPLFAVDVAGLVVWPAVALRHTVARRPDADLVVDGLNQGLGVPLRHAGSWWSALGRLVGRRRTARRVGAGVLGLLIGLPLIAVVASLLAQADDRFDGWVGALARALEDWDLGRFLPQIILSILLAAYAFAILFANARRSQRGRVDAAQVESFRARCRRLPVAALATPLAVLAALYAVFFAALGSYLTSGLAGRLPDGWTHAEYARQGFFELAGVAAINLAVCAAVRTFAARPEGRYPTVLRALGATLAGLTVLLVVTALSKLLLYIGAYGLTQLRLNVFACLVVWLVVFTALTVWHIRPFRLSALLVPFGLAAVLALAWADTDGIVARWNTDHYLSGDLDRIDVPYLANLSEAAVPALVDLRDNASAASVRAAAAEALSDWRGASDDTPARWTTWNWQTARAQDLTGD
ncbi:MAG: DUF4173 domain-containing protein [Propionibacteriaceae bacterium]|jgi:hypothetical protein|nr:DUF4173 domain-containing protein [Propionibacteriaceae bacterium]